MIEQFKKEVLNGLSANPKFLSSKYFYDEIGDELFVDIMNMPEYYLTDAEFEIFSQKTSELIDALGISSQPFQLIELGAGDGTKTKELLKELVRQQVNFEYIPIDISNFALTKLKNSLNSELPQLTVSPRQGDYFQVLSGFKNKESKKIVLFLGSNLGNLKDELSAQFLQQLDANLNTNDKLLLGLDLIKSAEIVLPAYNDSQGITARFNLNLLTRINRELGGNFDVSAFKHVPSYTEDEGIAKSSIVSTKEQIVTIKTLNTTFQFAENEPIHTEISRKYNDEVLAKILKNTQFEVLNKIQDSRNYFADYILEKK